MTLNQIKTHLRPIIQKHINTNTYRVFVFGSRPGGFNGHFSDIDVGIEGQQPVSAMTLAELEDDLSQSDLPYFVDVVDFSTVSNEFKSVAKRHISYL